MADQTTQQQPDVYMPPRASLKLLRDARLSAAAAGLGLSGVIMALDEADRTQRVGVHLRMIKAWGQAGGAGNYQPPEERFKAPIIFGLDLDALIDRYNED